jgi:hypothetical protein
MTITVYSHISTFFEIGGDMKEQLRRLGVDHIFQPLAELYQDDGTFNTILFFILEVYSVDSKAIVLHSDWVSFKKAMFERYKIEEKHEPEVLHLTSPVVRDVCRAYVDYQEAPVWRHYCMLQDLYTQFLGMALDMNKSVAEKHNAAVHARELLTEIETANDKLKQTYGLLERANKELPKRSKLDSRISLAIEDHVSAGNYKLNEDEEEE